MMKKNTLNVTLLLCYFVTFDKKPPCFTAERNPRKQMKKTTSKAEGLKRGLRAEG